MDIECQETVGIETTAVMSESELYTIRGKINLRSDKLDLDNTRILIDDGQHIGFLHSDGTFSIPGLSSGSYVLEVSAPRNVYEPIRIDINSKGKIRARRLNLVQPSDITIMRYPLHFESKGYPNYFFKREQFRIMDILLSPMVLMMVLPLVLMFILPKLINQDPELQRELQQTANIFPQNQNMPSLSEMAYNLLEGGKKKPVKKQDAQGSKRR